MTELSLAARAVLNAAHDGANQVLFDIGDDNPVPSCAAAALRAAVDQVVPKTAEPNDTFCCPPVETIVWKNLMDRRQRLLAIADELEAQ